MSQNRQFRADNGKFKVIRDEFLFMILHLLHWLKTTSLFSMATGAPAIVSTSLARSRKCEEKRMHIPNAISFFFFFFFLFFFFFFLSFFFFLFAISFLKKAPGSPILSHLCLIGHPG